MAVTDSRQRKGVLTLDGTTFSCQPTAVSVVPTEADGNTDTVEVLCGDLLTDATGGSAGATLNFTSVQDFTADGLKSLLALSWKKSGEEVDFEWQPTSEAQDRWVGKVQVKRLTVGGGIAARLTSDGSWNVTDLTLPQRWGGDHVIGPDIDPTGVTAGNPATLLPPGAKVPADLAALKAHAVIGDAGSNKPGAAWTTGQVLALGTGTAHWDGDAWAAGAAT